MQNTITVTTTPTSQFLQRWGVTLAVAAAILITIAIFYGLNPTVTTAVLAATVRQSIPLVLGALCGLMGEARG